MISCFFFFLLTFSLFSSGKIIFCHFFITTYYHIMFSYLTHNGSPCVPENPASVKWYTQLHVLPHFTYPTTLNLLQPNWPPRCSSDRKRYDYRAVWLNIPLPSDLHSNATFTMSSTLERLIKIIPSTIRTHVYLWRIHFDIWQN